MRNKSLLNLLIICSLLFVLAACSNVFEAPRGRAANGEGYFSLQIGGGGHAGGRTIMPQEVLAGFSGYTLVFTDAGFNKISLERTNSDLGNIIKLPEGIWDLDVTAYGKNKAALAGERITNISIARDSHTSKVINLKPLAGDSVGTFRWNFTFSNDIVTAFMNIKPVDPAGFDLPQVWLVDNTYSHPVTNINFIDLSPGVYLLTLTMNNGSKEKKLEQYLHIYPTLTSSYTDDFSGVFKVIVVTSDEDKIMPEYPYYTEGSLRKAISDASRYYYSMIYIEDTVKTINLISNLTIYSSVVIEGNGVIITRGSGFSDGSLLSVPSGNDVMINRVQFMGGKSASSGGAVINNGNLTSESCIFNDNQTTYNGGAIYNSGTMTIKGCTLYNNSAKYYGGAIYNNGTLNLTGNIFYGNTADLYPVAYGGGVISGGCNVVDVDLGTGKAQSGWVASDTDLKTTSLPISGKSFRLLNPSAAENVIASMPSGYPKKDFFGKTINYPAAAGAVQEYVLGSGFYLDLSVNNPLAGTAVISSPEADDDGLYTGPITLIPTPAAEYSFEYWLKQGVPDGNANPYTLNISGNTKVVAVFLRTVTVTSPDDTGDSGTLRYALDNARDGDVITISVVSEIALNSALPEITKSITIEGNGAVITRDSSFTNAQSLLSVSSGTVNISRIHFTDGGAAYSTGGAVNNNGALTLESCIFSGNQAQLGGAILNSGAGTLTVKGCTFYNNSADVIGGAIYAAGGTVTLTGNLFYKNTAGNSSPVAGVNTSGGGVVTSGGYNVVDVDLGSGEAGWNEVTGDTTFEDLGIDIDINDPINLDTFVPVSELRFVPSGKGLPVKDFNGETRSWPGAPGAVK